MSDAHNFFYYDPRLIDLAKLRDSAYRAAMGDKRNKPIDAIVHYHDSTATCKGVRHEVYKAKDKVEGSVILDEASYEVVEPIEDKIG